MSGTMRAARFDVARRALTVTDVPVPVPGPAEVLVRVEACGICLSDVHLIDGSLPGPLPVVTPGHEAAGTVEAVGALVPGWAPGDRVVMAAGRPCGRCRQCTRGRAVECEAFEIMGFGFDGAWAQYVVVPAGALTAVPESIPFEQAAVLADAVSTPYAALTARAGLRAGESIGLWGIGGLGVHAVQIARLVGAAPIIALDPLPSARERVRELTSGRMLDVAVDLVGSNAVLAQGVSCLGRYGRCVMVGLSLEPVQLGSGLFFGLLGQSLLGHLGYEKHHLDELVALLASGRLDVSRSVSDLLPLEDVGRGVEQLVSKQGDPVRLVVQPWR